MQKLSSNLALSLCSLPSVGISANDRRHDILKKLDKGWGERDAEDTTCDEGRSGRAGLRGADNVGKKLKKNEEAEKAAEAAAENAKKARKARQLLARQDEAQKRVDRDRVEHKEKPRRQTDDVDDLSGGEDRDGVSDEERSHKRRKGAPLATISIPQEEISWPPSMRKSVSVVFTPNSVVFTPSRRN